MIMDIPDVDKLDLNLLSLERLNTVSIITAMSKAARKQGWSDYKIRRFQEEAAFKSDEEILDLALELIN
jgi:hypothetical protein